jgi:ABC-type transporter Mla maintaining outer membrane lipid asymmetry ATPase subunit MlaF
MTALLEFAGIPLQRVRRRTLAAVSPGSLPPASQLPPEDDVTLSVLSHQTVAVLGDEASGVDSLGGLALGLEPSPEGAVRAFGTEIFALPRRDQLAFRRRIGYLPAGDGLLHNLTLRDNIRLPLGFGSDVRPGQIAGRTDLIVAQVRLGRAADLRPAQANEEERRRAALGRAIALDPELLILEQPFDGLTDRVAAEVLELARGGELPEGGRRAVLITGQDIPMLLRPRVDRMFRIVHGRAVPTAA